MKSAQAAAHQPDRPAEIEIPPHVLDALDYCRTLIDGPVNDIEAMFRLGAAAVFRTIAKGDPHRIKTIDAVDLIGQEAGLFDADHRQSIIDAGFKDAEQPAPAGNASVIITPADMQTFFAEWQSAIAEAPDRDRAWADCIATVRGKMATMEVGRIEAERQLRLLAVEFNLFPPIDIANKVTAALDGKPAINGHDAAPATTDNTSAIVPAKFITPPAWPNEAPPPVHWLVPGFIQRGDVTTLHGDGGAGKTDIALRLAANVARAAAEWLGLELTLTANGLVVFISAEDPERKVRRRLWQHAKHDGYDLNAVTNLHLWFPAKMSGTVLAVPDRYTGTMKPTAAFQSLAAAIVDLRPVLVIADNVAATFGGNQNDRAQVRSFVNLWGDIAEGPSRPAVILLDHPSLSGITNGTGRGGNMDWRNAVRSALHLYAPIEKADADRGVRILETTKINEGKPRNPLRLVWADGGLQLEHAPSSHHRAAKEQQCEEIFLRLLDERTIQGSHVGRKTSAMYAPKVFADAPENDGFTKHAFAAAMERLFKAGTIREAYDSKRRHDYIDRASTSG